MLAYQRVNGFQMFPASLRLKKITLTMEPIAKVPGGWFILWEFQDPKLQVPTIYKAYVLGLCKGISPQNMALYGAAPPI